MEDFTTKKGRVPSEGEMSQIGYRMKCTKCKATVGVSCGKNLYFSDHTPVTSKLKEGKEFTFFTHPRIGNGAVCVNRMLSTARDAACVHVANQARHWHEAFRGCHVHAKCTEFSELPADFQDILRQKVCRYPEMVKRYVECQDPEVNYEKDMELFAGLKKFLDLVPEQPSAGMCGSHKRRADGGVRRAPVPGAAAAKRRRIAAPEAVMEEFAAFFGFGEQV